MIDDSTPHRVFKICELTRLIAGQLTLISKKSVVNLACTCRALEEPILSTLWETQYWLSTLLEVLPEESWEYEQPTLSRHVFRIVKDPSQESWNRVRRYASWMRKVRMDDWESLGEETFSKLCLNLPPGGWFPALRELSWCITEANLPYADLSFSPHLKILSISPPWSWKNTGVPLNIPQTLASTISALQTSSLQRISVGGHPTLPWAHFKDSFSSVVLRCGSSFTEYDSPVPLSDAAVNHLIQSPHLRTLRIHGPPPNYSVTSPPLDFPPLKELTFGEGAREWLSLLERLDGASTARGPTLSSKVKESLKVLKIEDPSGVNINASFVSPIQNLRNLVSLDLEVYCHDEGGEYRCTFNLNNDNVTELATALTQLESLFLGRACFKNTCLTTVACLLPISVHCIKLKELTIHFNTTNIVDDFKNILEDRRFQQLRSAPRCSLTCLNVYRTTLALDEPDFETVVNGMTDIFPSLTRCEGFEPSWDKLSRRIPRP